MSNLGAFSMWDLFRSEVESQMRTFTEGLLALESGGSAKEHLAATMRAAHSIKGAARIVHLDVAVTLSHAMEDCLVAAQEGALTLDPGGIDVLLGAGDLLAQLSSFDESAVPGWVEERRPKIDLILSQLSDVRAGKSVAPPKVAPPVAAPPPAIPALPAVPPPAAAPPQSAQVPSAPVAVAPSEPVKPAQPPVLQAAPAPPRAPRGAGGADRGGIKVTTQSLNRLMGLAGESLVQSRWFEPFSDSLLELKYRHSEINDMLESLQAFAESSPETAITLEAIRRKVQDTRRWAAEQQTKLDAFGLRSAGLSDRLYREVVASRMRPFGDGVEGFPRLVRDLARQLGKQVQLEILGTNSEVDREILDRLEAPLNHAIRNSVDHGIERPEVRVAAGKPPTGTIRLEARHRSGLFVLTISDDGCGADPEALRALVIARGLAAPDMAANFSESELLEFLFLPGFSTARTVTDISGRGVGLDAVQEMAKSVGGLATITSRPGHGLTIQLELPLTLSVVRTFIAEIGEEPFAFPLTRIARVVKVSREELSTLEGQQYFTLDGERVGVVSALEVLDLPGKPDWNEQISVVVLGDRATRYGLAVDKFVGEFEMVVRPLDARLGKVPSISAAALMDDGSPVLIVDVEDLARSVETLLHGGRLRGLGRSQAAQVTHKRILVVDDSVTVREVQRSLLQNRGYIVEVAVDGMDGWNALRAGSYDLTITDVDMPRMTGIELVAKIKADPKLHALPVIIVSYKDREEDRMRGLDAGADRYLTKSSFHDETLLSAVEELIGLPPMRIAIVNDVPMAVEALRRVVSSVPGYEVVWIAANGEEAVHQCAADVPDLILMDLLMPRMDGVEASRIIMRDSPCAILVVTATVGGNSSKVFEAMGWGALDAVNTPVLEPSGEPARPSDLLTKIAMLRKLIGRSPQPPPRIRMPAVEGNGSQPGFPLIAIGASTGGPAAISRVLADLPPTLQASIVVVQHVDELFAPGLASWLARESSRDVRIIRSGDRPDPSAVQLASTNGHLLLTPELTFEYSDEPVEYSYRPSVDVFFHTVATYWVVTAIGVLLTGMGGDGAKGLLAMRRAGWHTIAQDQGTSIVYGMPKAAAKIDAATEILPIDQIGAAIAREAALPVIGKKSHKRSHK